MDGFPLLYKAKELNLIYEEIYDNSDLNDPLEKNNYLFLGTKRIAKDSNGKITYYYTEHLGSTRAVQSGSSLTRLDYAPFGEDFRPASERYKFTGKEDDGYTGLYYFNARYYDPAIGRFITEDPVKDGGNWYVYCRNNPLSYVDPTGNFTAEIAVALAPITLLDGPLPILDVAYGLTVAASAAVEYVPLILMAKDAIENEGEPVQDKPVENDDRDKEELPPGYNPDTWEKRPASRAKPRERGVENHYDPEGGEWHYHGEDKYHNPHWDYKQSGNNTPWEQIPIRDKPPLK